MTGREVIGTFMPEQLVADTSVPLDVVTVTISKSTGSEVALKRGSVLAADASGKCSLLNGRGTSSVAAYVLAEPVTTSTAEDVVGVAYQTGKFIRQSLIVAEGYELSTADVKALRDAGIFMENAMM